MDLTFGTKKDSKKTVSRRRRFDVVITVVFDVNNVVTTLKQHCLLAVRI